MQSVTNTTNITITETARRTNRRQYIRWIYMSGLGILIIFILMGLITSQLSTRNGSFGDARAETEASYQIRASKLDLAAANSYPQQIGNITSEGSPNYHLEVYIAIDHERPTSLTLAAYDYPEEVRRYLQPSAKIESDSPLIQALAAEIIGTETDIVAIAEKSAAWTAQNITYDNQLARQIWNGRIDSLSALETLERGAGTCSEYTNLFIAIMRSQGIPARFVTGLIYGGSYHAWPEFYLYGVGWIPVEAQGGFVGTTTRHIKLLTGLDFVDIGVKLREIRASATQLEE